MIFKINSALRRLLVSPACSGDQLPLQTIAGLMALLLAQVHLQREHTEALANELALREANQRMEAFLGIICHELKILTPVYN